MAKSKKLKPVKQSEMVAVKCKLPVVEVKSKNILDTSWIAEIHGHLNFKLD